MAAESPSIEVLNALAHYLQQKADLRFKQVVIGWPDSSRALSLPALSILVKGSPQLTHTSPYLLSMDNITGAESSNLYDCGEWNFSIQLDLWLKTAAERYDAQKKIIDAFYFGEERVSQSVRLKLSQYHNTLATYSFINSSIPDSSATPLAQEFRVMVDIGCMCSHLIRRDDERVITATELVDDITTDEIE